MIDVVSEGAKVIRVAVAVHAFWQVESHLGDTLDRSVLDCACVRSLVPGPRSCRRADHLLSCHLAHSRVLAGHTPSPALWEGLAGHIPSPARVEVLSAHSRNLFLSERNPSHLVPDAQAGQCPLTCER